MSIDLPASLKERCTENRRLDQILGLYFGQILGDLKYNHNHDNGKPKGSFAIDQLMAVVQSITQMNQQQQLQQASAKKRSSTSNNNNNNINDNNNNNNAIGQPTNSKFSVSRLMQRVQSLQLSPKARRNQRSLAINKQQVQQHILVSSKSDGGQASSNTSMISRLWDSDSQLDTTDSNGALVDPSVFQSCLSVRKAQCILVRLKRWSNDKSKSKYKSNEPLMSTSELHPAFRSTLLGCLESNKISTVIENTHALCRVSHQDCASQACSIAVGVIVAGLLELQILPMHAQLILDCVKRFVHDWIFDEQQQTEQQPSVLASEFDRLLQQIPGQFKPTTCTAYDLLSCALWSLRSCETFATSLQELHDQVDSTAHKHPSTYFALAGAILGCRYGFNQLPLMSDHAKLLEIYYRQIEPIIHCLIENHPTDSSSASMNHNLLL